MSAGQGTTAWNQINGPESPGYYYWWLRAPGESRDQLIANFCLAVGGNVELLDWAELLTRDELSLQRRERPETPGGAEEVSKHCQRSESSSRAIGRTIAVAVADRTKEGSYETL